MSYEAREKELRSLYEGKELLEPAERDIYKSALDSYLPARNQCLQDLVKLIADESFDNSAQEKAWTDKVNALKSTLANSLGGAMNSLRGVQQMVCQTALAEEGGWLNQLSKAAAIAAARDHIILRQDILTEWTTNLNEKWRDLGARLGTTELRMEEVSAQLKQILEATLAEAAGGIKTTKDFVEHYLPVSENLLRALPISPQLRTALQMVRGSLDALLKMCSDRGSRFTIYKEGYGEKQRCCILFAEFRDDTKEFIEQNNYEATACFMTVLAEPAMVELYRNAKMGGQQADMDQFTRELRSFLQKHLDKVKGIFDGFVLANQYKFYGPLKSEVERPAFNSDEWANSLSWYERKEESVCSSLATWRESLNRVYEIDCAVLPEGERSVVKALLSSELQGIIQGLDRLKEASMLRDLMDVIRQAARMANPFR